MSRAGSADGFRSATGERVIQSLTKTRPHSGLLTCRRCCACGSCLCMNDNPVRSVIAASVPRNFLERGSKLWNRVQL